MLSTNLRLFAIAVVAAVSPGSPDLWGRLPLEDVRLVVVVARPVEVGLAEVLVGQARVRGQVIVGGVQEAVVGG